MSYKPNPINLDNIKLSAEIEADVEAISRNVHEVWAQKRIQDGWGYDKDSADHPCLTDYDSLDEIEKQIDRATVINTIKMLIYLGYEIKREDGSDV